MIKVRFLPATEIELLKEVAYYSKARTATGIRFQHHSSSIRSCGTPLPTACFQSVIHSFKNQNCDAVVLGCIEIPLIVSDANPALPTLDSTRLLARAALRRAANMGAL